MHININRAIESGYKNHITMDVRPDSSEVRVIAGTTDNGISGPVIDFMEPHKREQLS